MPQRVLRYRTLLLEIMARADGGGVIVQLDPIARLRRGAGYQLVVAVGIHIELAIVDRRHNLGRRKTLVDTAALNTERGVRGTGDIAAHAIGTFGVDQGVVINRVRAVAEGLAAGPQCAPE